MDKDKPLRSGLIAAYSYDQGSKELTVTFKDSSTWVYKGVSADVVAKVFEESGSIGSKFIKLIKHGKYQATKSD